MLNNSRERSNKLLEVLQDNIINSAHLPYGCYLLLDRYITCALVVFGANSETPNLSIVKSQDDINKHLEEINERMEVFIKALTDDKLSQKYNNLFTLELMQLKHQYNSLLQFEKPSKDTLQDQEPSEEEKRKAEEKEIRTKLNLL